MGYRSTEFGVDSSSRFPFRARTDRQTDASERSIARRRIYGRRGIIKQRTLACIECDAKHSILYSPLLLSVKTTQNYKMCIKLLFFELKGRWGLFT